MKSEIYDVVAEDILSLARGTREGSPTIAIKVDR